MLHSLPNGSSIIRFLHTAHLLILQPHLLNVGSICSLYSPTYLLYSLSCSLYMQPHLLTVQYLLLAVQAHPLALQLHLLVVQSLLLVVQHHLLTVQQHLLVVGLTYTRGTASLFRCTLYSICFLVFSLTARCSVQHHLLLYSVGIFFKLTSDDLM
jgi:hypothetical protein